MQANEPTSKEYDDIAVDAHSIIHRVEGDIMQSARHARRMYGYSDVDNGFLADALETMTRSLADIGACAERVRLHALACKIEDELREKEHQPEDKENEE